MHFCLVDRVIERDERRLVAVKNISAAEEYLQDHFPSFPVIPGVFMVEAMVQAARALLDRPASEPPMVLGRVRALKFGTFGQPGDVLRIEVTKRKTEADGAEEFDGEVRVMTPGVEGTAAAGRFALRPARVVGGALGS